MVMVAEELERFWARKGQGSGERVEEGRASCSLA